MLIMTGISIIDFIVKSARVLQKTAIQLQFHLNYELKHLARVSMPPPPNNDTQANWQGSKLSNSKLAQNKQLVYGYKPVTIHRDIM